MPDWRQYVRQNLNLSSLPAEDEDIRMAIGAQRRSVIGLVLGESIGLVLIGTAMGLMVAVAAGRLLTNLLFGLKPADGITFASVTVLMVGISVVASCLPAIKASRVDPIAALRHE